MTPIKTFLMVLAVSVTLLFVAATFFRQTNQVEDRAVDNSAKVAKTAHTVTRIKRILIKKRIIVQGKHGLRGGRGPRGIGGSTGARGPRGHTGAAGSDGANAALSRADLVDLAALLTPDQIRAIAQAICDTHPCMGTKGKDGQDGAKGEPGPIGPKGDKGETGAAGADGTPGAPGAAGPQGAPGAAGPAGPAIAAFGFGPFMPGATYTCADPDGDLQYTCTPLP